MVAAVAREMNKRRYKLALQSPSENCEKLANELGGLAVRGKSRKCSWYTGIVRCHHGKVWA